MAEPNEPASVLLIVAAFSRWPQAIASARDKLQNRYGPIALDGPVFDFLETHYYDDQMGSGLKKTFFAFERLIHPVDIVNIKRTTNELEREMAQSGDWSTGRTGISRPVNLDPGYLNAGKWVLATTKDQAHRVYLGRGIFAEVTLRFEYGAFVPWPWTYPNYCREDYRAFFKTARDVYLRLLRSHPAGTRNSPSSE